MKKKYIFLFLLILIFTRLSAQTKTILVYYDPGKKNIREIYQVLSYDSTVKHGDYRLYSENGMVFSRGRYQNGTKTGNWFIRNTEEDQINYGSYDSEDKFTGVTLKFDNTIRLTQAVYYRNGLILQNDFGIQKQLIDSLARITSRAIQGKEPANNKKSIYFNFAVRQYNALTADAAKFEKGSRLIYELAGHNELVFEYIESVKEMNRISKKINDAYKGKMYPVFRRRLSTVEKSLEVYNMTDSLRLQNEISRNLISAFPVMESIMDQILLIQKQLSGRLQNTGNNYKLSYPAIYARQITNIEKQFNKLNSTDSLELFATTGNMLLNRLDSFDIWYRQFEKFDKVILAKIPEIKNSITLNYPALVKTYLNPVEDEFNTYRNIDSAEQKLLHGNNIIIRAEYLETSIKLLKNSDQIITAAYEKIKQNYLKNYPGIFKNEIKPLEAEIDKNRADSIIDRKIETAQQIITRLNKFDEDYKIIQQTDLELDAKLPVVKGNYHDNFKVIYDKEIVELETRKNEYEKTGSVIARINTGKEILDKLNEYDEIFKKLIIQKSGIDSLFPPLKLKYKETYSDIYKIKIKEIDNQINIYNSMSAAAAKMVKGEEVLTEIKSMAQSYDILQVQENDILQKIQKAEADYKTAFPMVAKAEIKDIRAKYKEYTKIETVDKKVSVGTIIIERTDLVNNSLAELKELDTNIKTLIPEIQNKYKKSYSTVYKVEITPIILSIDEYDNNGYVIPKINSGKKILEKLKYYLAKYSYLTDQSKNITDKYNEFNELYKSRKDVKNIYKKGKMAYKEFFSNYEDESNIEKKCLMGEDIELILLKLISIANKDNAVLNTDIKSAETPADVKRKLGL